MFELAWTLLIGAVAGGIPARILRAPGSEMLTASGFAAATGPERPRG